MGKEYCLDLSKKEQKIVLNGKEYFVKPSFSIGSYFDAKKIIDETSNYKDAFIKMVIDKFGDKISKDELFDFDDSDYKKIIKLFLEDKKVCDIYSKCAHEDIFKDFFDSINEYIVKNLSKAFEETIPNISKMLTSLRKKIVPNIIDTINLFSEKIVNAIETFKIDSSDVAEPLKKWASYGWTIPDEAPINLFFEMPQSSEQADKWCIKYFDEKNLENIFNEIKKNKDIIPNYIEEAIKLYRDGYYRGSAMLIIACMDKVFSSNIVDDNARKYKKQIGNRAVSSMIETLNKNEKDFILNIFILYNLLEYLKILFTDGDDFNNEPDNINRNYLMHGWQEREISEVECIKLFNALKILVESIEEIKELYDNKKMF